MSCCEEYPAVNKITSIEDLMKIPVLRYLKEPVNALSELYVRYPDGGEYGWFAWVKNLKTLAYWDVDSKKWETIAVSLLSSLGIDSELMQDGDVPVWDSETNKFVVINMGVIGSQEW